MFNKKFVIGAIIIIIVLLVIVANNINYSATSSKDINPTILFQTSKLSDEVNYTISINKMIDTYIIASALYLDFDSRIILPNTEEHSIYKKAKEFFIPYKNHSFIKSMHKYVKNGDVNGDVIGVLLSYSPTASLNKLHNVDDKYKRYLFKEDKDIEIFIRGLKDFYKDSNANKFFSCNKALDRKVKTYIQKNTKESKIIELIKSTEEYVNTKNKYFGELPVAYETVLTIFRPSMASFYSYETKNGFKIISFQSPNDISQNPYKLDICNFVENVIHEFLHSYINEPICNITISNCKDISKYYTSIVNNKMYSSMPLTRQIDEYIVRAIEGRIYSQTFGEEYAKKTIINKEIEFGGFERLGEIYNMLSNYEKDRDKYLTIDDFLPQLVEELTRRAE